MKRKHLIILLFIVPTLIYTGRKVFTYLNAKSLFLHSWDNLEYLEITPTNENFETYNLGDLEKIVIGQLLFSLPNEEVLKDTFDLFYFKRIYSNESKIILMYDSPMDWLDYMLNLTNNKSDISGLLFQDYFDVNGISNNYQLLKHAFNLKPSEISWFESNNAIAVKYTLLRLKEMLLIIGYENGFYNFEFENFKGFLFNQGNNLNHKIVTGFSNFGEQYSIISEGVDSEIIIELMEKIENIK